MSHISPNTLFQQLEQSHQDLKLTALRKDILKIIVLSRKPISAADILKKLKKVRATAEPPTVYRVIEYLLEKHVIHKINSENKFVFCTHPEHYSAKLHGFILVCQKCASSEEVLDGSSGKDLLSLANRHHFHINNALLEITGVCQNCYDESS